MQKKNVLTMALSVSLVGVIAVGGTLAYLSATTEEVKNTFTSSASIKMKLDEAQVVDGEVQYTDDSKTVEKRVQANTYENILPGIQYYKDPTVTLEQVPTGGVYVFARIDGLNPDVEAGYTVSTDLNNQKWKKVETVTLPSEEQYDLYVYVGEGTEDDNTPTPVDTEKALPDIFQHVTFNFANDEEDSDSHTVAIDNINVVAYAVQAEGVIYDNDMPGCAVEMAKTQFATVNFED